MTAFRSLWRAAFAHPPFVVGAGLWLALAVTADAQTGWQAAEVDNWLLYQKNENETDQWKYQPRLYLPYRFDNGVTFTQRVDLPLIYTNDSGPGNPGGGWSGGAGDMFIEEIVESAEVATNLRLKASVRFVFPTGKQKPFGNSQYQWAPGGGIIYAMPDVGEGVTLQPYVRYFSGFAPQASVSEIRTLDLYPAATIGLPQQWKLLLYPENPITYNHNNGTWFVPLDLMLSRRIDRMVDFGIGGAFKLGNTSDPSYRYIIDARLTVTF